MLGLDDVAPDLAPLQGPIVLRAAPWNELSATMAPRRRRRRDKKRTRSGAFGTKCYTSATKMHTNTAKVNLCLKNDFRSQLVVPFSAHFTAFSSKSRILHRVVCVLCVWCVKSVKCVDERTE